MKFCGSCGQQIPDDANACPYCGAFQDGFTPAAAAGKKAFPVKKALVGAAAVLVVLAVVFALVKILGGAGWKKPLDRLEDIANDQKVSESVIKDAVRCVAGNVGKKDLDDAIEQACDLKAGDKKLIDQLKDAIDRELEYMEDDLGKNLKFSYEVDDKEKLDEDDLEDYTDFYQWVGDMGVEAARAASDNLGYIEDYTDGDVSAKDAEEIVDSLKGFAKELKDAKVSAGYEVDLVIKIEGKDDDYEIDYTVAVVKLDGKWVLSLSPRDLHEATEEFSGLDPMEILRDIF